MPEMPLDMPDWPYEDYGFDQGDFDPLRFCDGVEALADIIMGWLETQDQDVWMHYIRSREFDPASHVFDIGCRMAAHPDLDRANAVLLFWRMQRGRYPYFADPEIVADEERLLPARGAILRYLAARVDSGDLTSGLRLSRGELHNYVSGFRREWRLALRRGLAPETVPFPIPDAMMRPVRGRKPAVPKRFAPPAEPKRAGLMMIFDGFCRAAMARSARSEANAAIKGSCGSVAGRIALHVSIVAAGWSIAPLLAAL